MGTPRFDWEAIPLAYAMDTAAMPLGWEDEAGSLDTPMAVNVGNPHAVFFVEDAQAIALERIGPRIERDPVFAQGVNVNVASLSGDNHITLRVWERGAGLTRACGTGACASAVAGIVQGLVHSPVRVTLPGGDLVIEWARGKTIRMTGPASEAFRGEFEWDDYA
jgi:diaminopimelate epimerase